MDAVVVHYAISGRGASDIAASVEAGVAAGTLAPGETLPPLRELAGRLGVNPNTVAAAYRLLRDRGVVETAGRRGTRIRPLADSAPRWQRGIEVPADVRDLTTGNPDVRLLPRLRALPTRREGYGQADVTAELGAAARARLALDDVPVPALGVVSSALDGIERVLGAHLRPGDRIAVEDPGWANLLDLVAALGLHPEPVRLDEHGPLPDDFARALRRGVSAAVITSRAQNPTGAAVSALGPASCASSRAAGPSCWSSRTTTLPRSPDRRCIPWSARPRGGPSSGQPARCGAPTCAWRWWPVTS
jgi:DNA-binding transcriptional MocR family regulator